MPNLRFLALVMLIPLLLIGCATTPEEREYQKNKAIIDSAVRENKPKPVINPVQAVISDTIRRR